VIEIKIFIAFWFKKLLPFTFNTNSSFLHCQSSSLQELEIDSNNIWRGIVMPQK
jgi:hypothetical protein